MCCFNYDRCDMAQIKRINMENISCLVGQSKFGLGWSALVQPLSAPNYYFTSCALRHVPSSVHIYPPLFFLTVLLWPTLLLQHILILSDIYFY